MYFRYYFKCQPDDVKLIIRNNNNITRLICWQIFSELLPSSVYVNEITTDTGTFITSVDCIVQGRTYCIHRLPLLLIERKKHRKHQLWKQTKTTSTTINSKQILLNQIADELADRHVVNPQAVHNHRHRRGVRRRHNHHHNDKANCEKP